MVTKCPVERDYFTDHTVLLDPYDYFEEMRPRGPICQLETHDCLLVTGFQECVEVLRNPIDFSSINSLASSAFPLPFEPKGSDISEQIEANRDKYVGGDLVVTFDDDRHTNVRSLISRMFTPSRLKANEAFMQDYATKMVKEVVAEGGCELVSRIATPYVTMVIADLLGVPDEDRKLFEAEIAKGQTVGSIDNPDKPTDTSTLEFMGTFFYRYFQERAENPGTDLLSELVTATYPDGETKPDLMTLISLAVFMFAAGQDTSAKLLGNALRYIVDVPGLQQQLREDRKLIPWMLEEVLRLEGSSKATHRLARRDTKIGDYDVPAGTQVIVAIAAANRDPRRWGEDANEFKLKRPGIREHIGFSRGQHTCAGAPLARVEVATILNCFFDHTSDIRISEEKHGKPGARHYQFEPSFIIRGLDNLYVELDPK
ncbi:cytochrome P450 [Aestuariicella hydrocarbonica]|uniref:Cytochrome P450 n=1 Tax=Pseudomaricurvus hydrocarbonicus TaxID=1470433 RepID=A0A9E5MMS5_9GAMM|nr:cytochrome P450 [Aestuariicella hydrocarbonica]NHO67085.1 cytochrome P450 [Aestuariicella hydrocarbonica]